MTGQCVTAGGAMTAICQGGTSDVLGGSFGDTSTGATWSSDDPGGTFANNEGSTPGLATFTASASAPSLVTLTLTSIGGACAGTTVTKQITVNQNPTVNEGGVLSNICQEGTSAALGGSFGGGATGAVWSDGSAGGSFTGNGGSTPGTATYTASAAFTSPVTLTLTTSGGFCGLKTASKSLTVITKPLPDNVQINGSLKEFATLTVSYDYTPGPCFPEILSLTEISWYRANNSGGSGSAFITTKTGEDKTLVLSSSEVGKFIQVRVKLSDGTILLSTVSSIGWAGPVASNEKPVASSVSISGLLKVTNTITGEYVYSDTESDPEGGTIYEWYRADNASGSGSVIITGATTKTYILTKNERDKYIRFKVTPKALSGTTPGISVPTIWIGPVTDNPPVATNVLITGLAKVGNVITGHYQYSDTEGDLEATSTYQWYTGTSATGAGSATIGGATSISYLLTNNEIGKYIGFSVIPFAQAGIPEGIMVKTGTWMGLVTNDKPVAASVSITGSLNVNGVLTGHYIYSDTEGDTESASSYQWYSANTLGDPYTTISGETGIAHSVGMTEQGNYFIFHVTPKAISGTATGDEVVSPAYGPANTKPYADNITISGTAAIGSTLTGSYLYHDIDGDLQGTSSFRWLRNPTDPIPGATSISYVLTSDDEGYKITLEVTPVSSGTAYPSAGSAVKSAETSIVVDPVTGVPEAKDVCIDGIRTAGQTLTGKYYYNFHKSEGTSEHHWNRNGIPIIGATGIHYILKQTEDIDTDADITFSVTPVSSNIPARTGAMVTSIRLARIALLKDNYSVAESDVVLTANETGGVFSGPGVSGGIFSPRIAETIGSPHTLAYLLNILSPTHNCSQQSTKQVNVKPNVAYFDGFEPLYCHDSGEDVITVSNIPVGSDSYLFKLTNPKGLISQTGITAIIDPGKMSPGENADTLYFSYSDLLGTRFRISQPFVIDSVGEAMKIINLDASYCLSEPKIYISVEGVYPPGGTAIWSGDILSDEKVTSANMDPALGLAGHSYPITYRYKSLAGCYSAVLPKDVTLNPLPDPSFALSPTCNIDGGEIPLVPIQTGGVFSGNGVSGNKFFPALAGLGEYEITYSITDANNCFKTLGKKTTIRKAKGEFSGIPSVICSSDTTYNVKVSSLPAGVTITGFINTKKSLIYTPGALNAYYKVNDAGSGMDTLTFSYKWDGIDYSISTKVNVDSLGQVVIRNLSPDQLICNNIAPFELFTSINGGVFAGPVTGGYLDPLKATGSTSVTYVYTNQKTGCSTYTTIPITIYPAPKVSFIPRDVCIESNTDTTFFINNTTSVSPIESWLWEFSDEGGSQTSPEKYAGYLYRTGSFHKVSLTATTVNNCAASKDLNIDFGVKPRADFYWKKDCMHPNDSISLFDSTTSPTLIVSRSWSLLNGPEFSTGKNTKYIKTDTGYLNFRYIVKTNYINCSDTAFKAVYIRPSIPIPSDGYFQNFETGKGGWVKGESTANSWLFGTPDRPVIDSAASGKNAWFTGYSLTVPKIESSSIVSPCFDFTNSERPVIRFKQWRRFTRERDGSALQYKIGDERTWQYLGTLNDGIEWFNSAVIKGRPGGDQLGWTNMGTPDKHWIESGHTLDELKGKSDVKFRIAYGSDGFSDQDGIAFDDIRIGERMRNVLLEHFTNMSDNLSSSANTLVNAISSGKKGDMINIQYHTNFPGPDPFYDYNPGDASARILFYGLMRAPYTFLDGGTKKDFANIYDDDIAKIDNNDITKRSLINSKFAISLDPVISGGILSIKGQITALEDINADNLALFLAVTEKENKDNYTGAQGEKIFYNVFRKFVPDAGGIIMKNSWTKGEVVSIAEKTWPVEKILRASDIEIVAFLQNAVTKEIYQAFSVIKPNVIVGIEDPGLGKPGAFALYPNPARDKITIAFEKPLTTEADIIIYDFRGLQVNSYKAGPGSLDFTIENPGLRGGIYLVRVSMNGIDFAFKKLVITGK